MSVSECRCHHRNYRNSPTSAIVAIVATNITMLWGGITYTVPATHDPIDHMYASPGDTCANAVATK